MPDMEKVIKSLKWFRDRDSWREGIMIHDDHAEVRKQICDNAIDLLKEKEAVKPVLDEQTGRIWLCGKCGSYVGFEDNDPHDPNELDKYCRECGRPVLWEGR